MSSSDFQIVKAQDFREGDILLGPEYRGSYSPFYNQWEVANPPKNETYIVHVDLRGTDGSLVRGWATGRNKLWAIQRRELKYDPMQQGDREEDI